ncbi:hypothetical protein [Kitasatospora kifunensis]|uniref:Uncharacterized protein n=1 Tax=Kitasatospora kifunensis TaxID=58351 RepID=A0A7W7VTK9_KITKI|nr:hypothetical protein [Kitasatospora kifunensis]MBB4922411.1 hypothetical protein [Kitasatospora kifunensis]
MVRRREAGLLLGGLVVAIAASGVGGYLDWHAHQADERSGRAATLCGLPTGHDTPLGRLLPAGGQQLEDYGAVRAPDSVSRSCTIRVDGRTALVISAGQHDGEPTLPTSAAQQSGTQSFGVGTLSAAWARGAAVADYCLVSNGHVELEVTAGEAARTAQPDGGRADFEAIAAAVLPEQKNGVCG